MQRKKKAMKPKFQTSYHQKVGPHLEEVDLSSKDWSDNKSSFIYIIAREEIEACDPRRLLHDLRTELDNPLYRSGLGKVCFSVEGYGEDPRDLLMIPEFRSFVRKVEEQSPSWLYFAMPGTKWLRIILAARTIDCQVVERDGKLRITLTNSQVAEFMQSQLKSFYELCELRGIAGGRLRSHLYETMQNSFPNFLAPPMN